jgi:DNA-binding protein HU-beta
MNKDDLIREIATEADIFKMPAIKAIDSITNTIVSTLKKGGRVTIKGFGTFVIVNKAERKGRNPQTGDTIVVKATKAPKFIAGKEFRGIIKE